MLLSTRMTPFHFALSLFCFEDSFSVLEYAFSNFVNIPVSERCVAEEKRRDEKKLEKKEVLRKSEDFKEGEVGEPTGLCW